MGYGDKTGKFFKKEERTCIKKHHRMEAASQAHRTTAAIQNACRRRNTGTSHSHNPLGASGGQRNTKKRSNDIKYGKESL